MKITADLLIQNLADSGLMSADEASLLCDTLSTMRGPTDSDTVAQELAGTDKLTAYQAECICRGETSGLVFDEYVVLDKIGQGGMGVVLKAQHRRMDRIVAVKKLTAAALESEDLVKRFYREVKASARLLHPNVVTALDAREHEGVHYLIMEYIEGQDLAEVLKQRGPLPVDEAVDYVVQVAQGLEFAHKHGVFHRDIKPANLLLDREGTVKILDMGLARIVSEAKGNEGGGDQLTSDDQVMGTCDYMAPEQAENTKGVDHRADIYSLGCTLYRLLTNQPPYTGGNLMQLLLAHRENPIPSMCDKRPDVPASIDAVFQWMVAKTREERYQSMTEVIEALQAAMGRGPVAAAAAAPDPGLMDFLKQIHQEPSGATRGGRGSAKADAAQATATVQRKTDPINDETIELSANADTDPSTMIRQPSTPATPAARPSRPAAHRKQKQTRTLLLIGVGVGLSLIGAAVVAAVLYVQANYGTVVVKTDDKDIQVLVKRGGNQVRGTKPAVPAVSSSKPPVERPAATTDKPPAEAASYRPPVIEPELVKFFAEADLYEFLAGVVNDQPSDFMLRLLYTEIAATVQREQVGSWRIGPGMTHDGAPYEFSVRNTQWFARKLSVDEAKEIGISGRSWGRTLNVMWSDPVKQIMKLESADVRIRTDGDGNRAFVGRIRCQVDAPQRVDYLALVFNTPSLEEGENITRNQFQYVRSERLPGDEFEVDIPLNGDERIPDAGRFYFRAFLFEPQASFYRISNELVWAGPSNPSL